MRSQDRDLAKRIADSISSYETATANLTGLRDPPCRACFIEQLIESDRRNRFVEYISRAQLSSERLDPSSRLFDPLKGSLLSYRDGDFDEACWLLFLFIHFGKHRIAGWQYVANVYGKLGASDSLWNWVNVSRDVDGFRDWLDANARAIKGQGGHHGFGNHRKYESLSGWSRIGTGAVVASYVNWIGPTMNHAARFAEMLTTAKLTNSHPFDVLYKSMDKVIRFGRTARFDYLSMAGKLGLIAPRPNRAYLSGSTGPLKGARLLFGPFEGRNLSAMELDSRLVEFEGYLSLGFDALEDALCNWQKSPSNFKPFRG